MSDVPVIYVRTNKPGCWMARVKWFESSVGIEWQGLQYAQEWLPFDENPELKDLYDGSWDIDGLSALVNDCELVLIDTGVSYEH